MDQDYCDMCRRPKWDGGHALNELECDESRGEVCKLYYKLAAMTVERDAAIVTVGQLNLRLQHTSYDYMRLRECASADENEAARLLGLRDAEHIKCAAAQAEVASLKAEVLVLRASLDEWKSGFCEARDAAGELGVHNEVLQASLTKTEEILLGVQADVSMWQGKHGDAYADLRVCVAALIEVGRRADDARHRLNPDWKSDHLYRAAVDYLLAVAHPTYAAFAQLRDMEISKTAGG